MKKNKKISKQILSVFLVFFIATIVINMTVVGYSFAKQTLDNVDKIGNLALDKATTEIELFIRKAAEQILLVRKQLKRDKDGVSYIAHDRELVIKMCRDILKDNDYIYGISVIYEEDHFDHSNNKYANTTHYYGEKGDYSIWVMRDSVAKITGTHLDFYQIPKKTLKTYISDPYHYDVNGKDELFVSLTAPIIEDNHFVGALTFDLLAETFDKISKDIDILDKEGTVEIVDSKGVFVAHSHDNSLVSKNIVDVSPDPTIRLQKLQAGEQDHFFQNGYGYTTHSLRFAPHMKPWQLRSRLHWTVVFKNLIRVVITVTLICISLIFVSIYFIRQSIKKKIKPLQILSDFGTIAAGGDLSNEIQIESDNEIGIVAEAMKNMIRGLKVFIKEIQSGTENIHTATRQLQSSSEELSSSTNEQASVTEEISCNMEEMAASVQQTAAQSTNIKESVLVLDKEMDNLVHDATQSMQLQTEIVDSSKLVDGIAKEIKILSLNAAVEAARAGEHGKGFAVVAREIQKLSENTSRISEIITDKCATSADANAHTTEVINNMKPLIDILKDNIDKIAIAADEQSQGIVQVSDGTQQLNGSTQANAASAEELASTVEELSAQAEQLHELTVTYKIE